MKTTHPGIVLAIGGCVLVLASSACTAPTLKEERGSTTSKYLAPTPLLTVKASSATSATLGIDEWRIFRGRGGVFLTGYSAQNKAVKGLATLYTRDQDGRVDNLLARVSDGSHFAVAHSTLRNETMATRSLPVGSQGLVRRAALDLGLLQAVSEQQVQLATTSIARRRAACRQNVAGTMLKALACVDARTGVEKPAELCRLDALANGSGNACIGLSGTGRGSLDASACGGNPQCLAAIASIQRENALDASCFRAGGVACIGAAGGWLPMQGFGNGASGGGFPTFIDGRSSSSGVSLGSSPGKRTFDPRSDAARNPSTPTTSGIENFGFGTRAQREGDVDNAPGIPPSGIENFGFGTRSQREGDELGFHPSGAGEFGSERPGGFADLRQDGSAGTTSFDPVGGAGEFGSERPSSGGFDPAGGAGEFGSERPLSDGFDSVGGAGEFGTDPGFEG
jgi:hypothetical protein